MSITRASQTPVRTGEYLTVSVAVADLQVGNITVASSSVTTPVETVADAKLGPSWRDVNGISRNRRTFYPVWVRSLTPTQRQAWVDQPGQRAEAEARGADFKMGG